MYPNIVIPKICNYLGKETRIIIMLRDPAERAYSGYQHVKRYNLQEDLDFETAFEESEARYQNQEEITPASRYKEIGLYYNQVKSFMNRFSHIHIIIYDDFKKDVDLTLSKVFNFLMIDNVKINTSTKHMSGGWQWKNKRIKKIMTQKNYINYLLKTLIPFKRARKYIRDKIKARNIITIHEIDGNTRKKLKDFYKEVIQKLSNLINRDLTSWTK